MSELLVIVSGVFLIFWIFQDILFTTYSMEGGGKITDFFLQNIWKVFLWFSGYNGRHKVLGLAGMVMMISLIFLWGLGLWFGVFLLFASDASSVIHSESQQATDLWEKLYYSGYVLTTMGLGDYVPFNTKWGIISSLFSFLGLVFITLMVSYALPVLSNIIAKKQLSLFIQHLGASPDELLLYLWNGKDFFDLKDISKELQQKILTLAKSHKAYPILHFFHSTDKKESLVITLCLIDEVLSTMKNSIPSDLWNEKDVLPLQRALDEYLVTMQTTYRYSIDKNVLPPSTKIQSPNLQFLTLANVKLRENEKIDYRRKGLWTQLLKSKGWTWAEIYPI